MFRISHGPDMDLGDGVPGLPGRGRLRRFGGRFRRLGGGHGGHRLTLRRFGGDAVDDDAAAHEHQPRHHQQTHQTPLLRTLLFLRFLPPLPAAVHILIVQRHRASPPLVKMMVYYIGFSGIKQVGSCEFFLNRADSCPLLLGEGGPAGPGVEGTLTIKAGPGSIGLLGFPHPSGPLALPPSPEGKASSGGGCVHRSSCLTFRGPLHTRQGSALTPSPGRRGLFSVAVSALVCSAFLSISAFNASRESNFRSGRRKWVRWREMVRS